jgi:mannose/cellobiose epimerase-like protein (N-acyl-D-glucosamine 2-epimerase family)
MKRLAMQQVSVSEIQRNLHKLNDFDIVEVVDKKRQLVKGYFLDSRYGEWINELIERKKKMQNSAVSLAGALHAYADESLMKKEEGAWRRHLEEKHKI